MPDYRKMGLQQRGDSYSSNYTSKEQALQQMKQRPNDARVSASRKAHVARMSNSPSTPWSPGGRKNRQGG